METHEQLRVFTDDPIKEDTEKEPVTEPGSNKSVFKAYLWFILGGFVGAHHMYLNNDYQAVLMIGSIGGCYGIGLIVDFFCIPSYVQRANNHPYYKDLVKLEMKHFKVPRLHWGMIAVQLAIGSFARTLVHKAIPYSNYALLRYYILPLASTIGVLLVGRVFHARSSVKATLLGSYLSFFILHYCLQIPVSYFPFDTTIGAVICYRRYQTYVTEPNPGKIGKHKKKIFLATLLLMCSLQGGYYYNNATVSIDGMDVPLKDMVVEFLQSSAWVQTQIALKQFYEEVWVIGVMPALNRLQLFDKESMSEEAAYVLLGVEENISSTGLKKRFRALTLEHHPDKHRAEEQEEASKKFMELTAAYEVVMTMRSYKTKIESAKLVKEMADRLNKYDKRKKQKKESEDKSEL